MNIQAAIPYLSVKDAKQAIAFYSAVFEVEPIILLSMPDGTIMHCEIQVGAARIFISEELPEHGGTPSPTTLGATSVAIHLYVSDCDQFIERMKQHGAEVLMTPDDMFWGERFGRVRDPFGHEWGIATTIKEMSAEEIQATAVAMFGSIDAE